MTAIRMIRGLLAGLLLAPAAAALAGDIGTTFTLQAQLKQAGQPVNQPADVRASLFDAASGGNQVGSTIQLDNVNVVDGVVAADLDFGAMAFFGESRFIELEIRVPHDPNNTAPFTLLNGRLPVRPTPEAIHAQVASSLRAPVMISGDDANGAIVTIENIAPGGAGLDVLGDLRVGPQQELKVDAETGNVLTQGSVTANTLSVAANGSVGGLLEAGNADVADDLNVGNDSSIANNLTVGNDATVTNDLFIGDDLFTLDDASVAGDLSVAGAYVDSTPSPGQQDQVLTSTATGTLWRDLIVGPLDMKNNALINIGTGGTSFTPAGDLILNGDLFVGNPTTLAVDATNGILTLGANKLLASAADGSLNIGPDMFTVNGATGDVFAQRSMQVAAANLLADDFGLTVGPNFEFRVKPDTGDLLMGDAQAANLTIEAGTGNLSTLGFVEPDGGIRDVADSLGTSGEVLSSTGSGVRWVTHPVDPNGNLIATGLNNQIGVSGSTTTVRDTLVVTGGGGNGVVVNGVDESLSLPGPLLDSAGNAGDADQFLSSTGSGTLWRDLIVGPLDLKNNAITNIGSSGSSFDSLGKLTLKRDLDMAQNGIVNIGTANSFFFPDGSLTVGPTLTARDAAGETTLSVSGTLTSSFVDFVVGLAQFSVDADTGNTVVAGNLSVQQQFQDSTGFGGDPGQVLASTGTGTLWANLPGSGGPGNFSEIVVTGNTGLGDDESDTTNVAGDATFGRDVTIVRNAQIQRDLVVAGDSRISGRYFDSAGLPGEPDQILSADGFGTLWRDLIIAPLDMKTFAITNIGSGGSSFGGDGSLNVNGDLNVGSGNFTVDGASGDATSQRNLTANRDLIVSGDSHINGRYFDSAGLPGEPQQILSATGAGTLWVDPPPGGTNCECEDFVVTGNTALGNDANDTTIVTGDATFNGDVGINGKLTSDNIVTNTAIFSSTVFIGSIQDAQASTGDAGQVPTADGNGGWLWVDVPTVGLNPIVDTLHVNQTLTLGDQQIPKIVVDAVTGNVTTDGRITAENGINTSFNSQSILGPTSVANRLDVSGGTTGSALGVFGGNNTQPTVVISGPSGGVEKLRVNGDQRVFGTLTSDAIVTPSLDATFLRVVTLDGTEVKAAAIRDAQDSTGTSGQIPTADGSGGWLWADVSGVGPNGQFDTLTILDNTILGNGPTDTTTVNGNSTFNGNVDVSDTLASDSIVSNSMVISSTSILNGDATFNGSVIVQSDADFAGVVTVSSIRDSQSSTGDAGQVPTADGNGSWLWVTPSGGGGSNPTYDTVHVNQTATWGANPQSPTATLNGTNGTLVTSGTVTAQNGFNAGTNSNSLLGRTAIAQGLSITGGSSGPALSIFAGSATAPGVVLNGPSTGPARLRVNGNSELNGTISVENNGTPLFDLDTTTASFTVPLNAQGNFNFVKNIVTDLVQVSPPSNPNSPVVQVTATADFAPLARFFNFQGAAPAMQIQGSTEMIGNTLVDGDLEVTGAIVNPSDARLKTNVQPIDGALAIVARMRGVRFDWNRDDFPDRRFSDGRQVGFIAQELKEVLPEVVHTDAEGLHSVDYAKVTAVLAEAVKELDRKVAEREAELQKREAQFQELSARLERVEALLAKHDSE